MNVNKMITGLGLFALAGGSVNSYAEALTSEIVSPPSVQKPTSQDGGYFELGLGFEFDNEALYLGDEDNKGNTDLILSIGAGYQWNGMFFEFYTENGDAAPLGSNTLLVGYNFLNTEHWALDIVAGPENGQISDEISSELAGISDREVDIMGGLRATGYWGDTIVQLMGRSELSDHHDGESFSAVVGHKWQVGNVQTHAAVGLKYASKEIVNYYLGVGEKDSASNLANYSAGNSLNYTAELGATYALSENWLIRSQFNYAYLSKEISESPILDSDNRDRLSLSLTTSYVF